MCFPIRHLAEVSLYRCGVRGEHLSHFSLPIFHHRGRMGLSITAAAVTVTVATFDMLAFCEMRLQFTSQKDEISTWIGALNQVLSGSAGNCTQRGGDVCSFAFGWTTSRHDRAVASKKVEEYPERLNLTHEKREGKISLFYNSLCLLSSTLWRFLQANSSLNLFGDLCISPSLTVTGEAGCNA